MDRVGGTLSFGRQLAAHARRLPGKAVIRHLGACGVAARLVVEIVDAAGGGRQCGGGGGGRGGRGRGRGRGNDCGGAKPRLSPARVSCGGVSASTTPRPTSCVAPVRCGGGSRGGVVRVVGVREGPVRVVLVLFWQIGGSTGTRARSEHEGEQRRQSAHSRSLHHHSPRSLARAPSNKELKEAALLAASPSLLRHRLSVSLSRSLLSFMFLCLGIAMWCCQLYLCSMHEDVFLYFFPVTQSLSHSVTQSLRHSVTQSLSHSVSQALSHLVTQSPSHSVSQSLSVSVTQ